MKTKILFQKRSVEKAFTFSDLLAIIAVLACLGMMILPALARTRTNSGAAQCLNNLKQMGAAWSMYSADNRGSLVGSYQSAGFPTYPSWALGHAGSATPGVYLYGATDKNGITSGTLWPYVKSFALYKCPDDRGVFNNVPGLRSYSINGWMNGRSFGDPSGNMASSDNWSLEGNMRFRFFRNESSLVQPSRLLVMLDEDEKSINDCMFLIDMGGDGRALIDAPARRHENGYSINYADGHTELVPLRDFRSLNWTTLPVSGGPANLDYQFLTNIATVRR